MELPLLRGSFLLCSTKACTLSGSLPDSSPGCWACTEQARWPALVEDMKGLPLQEPTLPQACCWKVLEVPGHS